MGGLHYLSDHLALFEDTCLVYLLIDGDHGLLVDCGSGQILDHIAAAGVTQIDWVLHTHFHRDQCAGDAALVQRGASLAVPSGEAGLFTAPEKMWEAGRQWHRYNLDTDWFAPVSSVPVALELEDYTSFSWRGKTLQVLPTPGHTKGSITILLEVDGRRVAFTGDLIAGPGRVWSLDALQWSYGSGVGILDGVQPEVVSLRELQAQAPDIVLPSHGEVMDRPSEAIDALVANLQALVRSQEADANDGTLMSPPAGLVSDRRLSQVSDHIWANQFAFANSYFVVADSGAGLFLDYGYPSFHHFMSGFRFTEHDIRELRERAGLKRIDLCIPSHYHDDHVGGIPYLQMQHGTKVWAHEVMVEVLEHPERFNLPCLLPQPIGVDRLLGDGETFQWEGLSFTAVHTPGHTHYHSALCFEIDGLRVAHTGDTFHAGRAGPILGGPIYQNRFAPGDFERSIERLRAWAPEIILTGHSGIAEVDSAWLGVAARRARDMGQQLGKMVALPRSPGLGLDPTWISIRPYASDVSPGESIPLSVHIRNPGSHAELTVRLTHPDGWQVGPREAGIGLSEGGEAVLEYMVTIPAAESGDEVVVVCADVTKRSAQHTHHLGQVAEAVIRVHAPAVLDDSVARGPEWSLEEEAAFRRGPSA